ncbi:hypothetical protein [Serratia aquatilis]|uniref:Uncharacterized protein n=1 Tax=Serratia aquatilis TaxID=1737515 RepID=A0ABV6EB93_9GAMM
MTGKKKPTLLRRLVQVKIVHTEYVDFSPINTSGIGNVPRSTNPIPAANRNSPAQSVTSDVDFLWLK